MGGERPYSIARKQYRMCPDVLLERAADLLVLIGVNERADSFIGKNFSQQSLVHPPIDDMDSRNASAAGGGSMDGFGKHLGGDVVLLLPEDGFEVAGQDLANELPLVDDAIHACDEDELGSL